MVISQSLLSSQPLYYHMEIKPWTDLKFYLLFLMEKESYFFYFYFLL